MLEFWWVSCRYAPKRQEHQGIKRAVSKTRQAGFGFRDECSRDQARLCPRSSSSSTEPLFHHIQIRRPPIVRQALDKHAPVLLLKDPIVEKNQQPAVMEGSD